ncbi:MAG TPA: STAS/SEC14 domain-containing protein [Phenylobacterium sp.]|uniref:STAS/SEC14 domain-containing protein n=1 Tax=Phenylobacterium sp. TaxID=1871053 RepID=UPI002F93E360
MLSIKTDETTGYIELTVDGAIERPEYEAAVKAIEGLLKTHHKINAVEVVRSFKGIEPSLWWQNVNYSFSRLDSFGRCAVVTDKGWLGPMARFFAAFLSVELRTFGLDELEAARAWAKGGD